MHYEIMSQSSRFIPMLRGFALVGREIPAFPQLLAVKLKEAGLDLSATDEQIQPLADECVAWLQTLRSRESKTYRIPKALDKKYRGCGNGIVVIDKKTNKILDFDYTNSKLQPLSEQNITMSRSAGKKIREDEKTITYRCNFSSYEVCLY